MGFIHENGGRCDYRGDEKVACKVWGGSVFAVWSDGEGRC